MKPIDLYTGMCANMCTDAPTCTHVNMCTHMCVYMSLHMCKDMCLNLWIDMCTKNMCSNLWIDMCTDMCVDMCTDIGAGPSGAHHAAPSIKRCVHTSTHGYTATMPTPRLAPKTQSFRHRKRRSFFQRRQKSRLCLGGWLREYRRIAAGDCWMRHAMTRLLDVARQGQTAGCGTPKPDWWMWHAKTRLVDVARRDETGAQRPNSDFEPTCDGAKTRDIRRRF